MLPNVMMPWLAKGGVGKTTIAGALAVATAQAGWKTLAVDLDPQGSLARVLGYNGKSYWDGGLSVEDAFASGGRHPLKVMYGIRENLDVIGGGPLGEAVPDQATLQISRDAAEGVRLVDRLLAPIAGEYHLIVLDLPPTKGALQTMALTTAHFLVCPITPSPSDLDGLAEALRTVATVHKTSNPDLEVLGVVMNKADLAATRGLKDAYGVAADLLERSTVGDGVPVLLPPIRASQATDTNLKTAGKVAVEFRPEDVQRSRKKVLQYLRTRSGERPDALSPTLTSMADDLNAVLAQIVARYEEGQKRWAAKAGVA